MNIDPVPPSTVVVVSSSGSAPSSPSSSRISKRKSIKPKSPFKKKNPRWEGQVNVPVFDLLPDELVIRIHSYLDVPTIGITAQLCSRFNEVYNPFPNKLFSLF
jgi:hypothetical protein